MQFNTLDWRVEDAILTLTLNRPEQMNSFTVEMANELIVAFNTASEDDSVKAIVVTGAGKAFCAGMDLSAKGNVFGLDETLKPTLEDVHSNYQREDIVKGVRDTGGRVTLAIYDCKKPVIAAINGAAVGIGATMTLAMDIRLVSEKARIGFVFKKLGIVPEACSSWFLPRIVGISQALEWTYSGDVFDATEAVNGRLAKGPFAPDDLLPQAYAIAKKIAEASAVSTAFIRQMMYRNAAQDHPKEAHRIDSLAMYYTSIEDGKEGVNAFLEKRPTAFTSKASAMPEFYPWWKD